MHPVNQKMLDIIFEQFAQVDNWDHSVVDGMIKNGYIQQIWLQVMREENSKKN